MSNRWVKRFEHTFSECIDKIDAVEIFNEVSGDGNLERQRRVAEASLIIASYLVSRGLRPVVFNYPVGAPTLQDATEPATRGLVEYVSKNGGGIGVHLYFDCSGYVPDTWNFARIHRVAAYPAVTYVATEAGVCRRYEGRWDPYQGWKNCPNLTAGEYARMLTGLFEEARRKGVVLGGVFVFTISAPYQGWESFNATELFP